MAHPQIIMKDEPVEVVREVSSSSGLYTGEMETVRIEDVGDKRIFHYAQRVDGILNDNERRRAENPDWNKASEFRQVASIPLVMWQLWESMGITNDQKELRKAIQRHREQVMVVDKNVA